MTEKKPEIILMGGGGHCKSCIDVIEQENKFSISGIVDIPEKMGEKILDYPVIGCDDDLADLAKQYSNFIISIGFISSPDLRFASHSTRGRLHQPTASIVSDFAIAKLSTFNMWLL